MFETNGWVLVSGGAGFIGGHIAERLLSMGVRVRILDNFATGSRSLAKYLETKGTLEVAEVDLRDREAVRETMRGVTHVVHEAALPSVQRSIEDPEITHQVNATGTLHLLEAARSQKVRRFVFAGSSSVYGEQEESPKLETMRPMPMSPYALTKQVGEDYCSLYASLYGVPTITLRYFNVFGPRQNPDSQYAAVIPLFVRAFLRGERPVVYGDGSQTRDFTYVSNVVDANLLALEGRGLDGSVVNAACGGSVSLLELLRELERVTGRQVDPIFAPRRAGDILHSQAAIDRARRDLGFEPTVGLREGLEKTASWFQAQEEA